MWHSRSREGGENKTDVIREILLACADEHDAECALWRKVVCGMAQRGTSERRANYRWRCGTCRKQYTDRVGTIIEDSPIPLRHWVYPLWTACASEKA
jgi:hypothetical protein